MSCNVWWKYFSQLSDAMSFRPRSKWRRMINGFQSGNVAKIRNKFLYCVFTKSEKNKKFLMIKIRIKNESRSKVTNANRKTESLHVSSSGISGSWHRTIRFDHEFHHFLDIWRSFGSNNALRFCNINVINTNHSCVSIGISITRDEDDPSEEETERLTIQLTTIVQNMTRRKANVLMETSKLKHKGFVYLSTQVTRALLLSVNWEWNVIDVRGARVKTRFKVLKTCKILSYCAKKSETREHYKNQDGVASGCVLQ